MSEVTKIYDLTDSDDGKKVINSRVTRRLNYKQGSSVSYSDGRTDNQLQIHIPAKRRQIGYDEYPNFDRQYIQNINIPTPAKTEGDKDDASKNHDDNYHYLMSLLPYLREIPKNRKMAIRHKLQKVFVDENARKSGDKNIDSNLQNLSTFPTLLGNTLNTNPSNQTHQYPTFLPPPYPYKQDVAYNYVSSAAGTSASVPLPNNSANLLVQQQPNLPEYTVPVGLPSGHQQYYKTTAYNNANNNSSFSYNSTAVDNNNSSFNYIATAVDNTNGNNNNSSFGYNANNNKNKNTPFGCNATTLDNNNYSLSYNAVVDNNNSSLTYNAAVDNNNSSLTYNAAVDNNNSSLSYNAAAADNNKNNSLSYNAIVDNDNTTFTNQLGVTGEPQTFAYL